MYLVGNIPNNTDAVEIDPAVHQQYVDLFGGLPRSTKVQAKIERNAEDAASGALGANFDRLAAARFVLARSICDLSTGAMADETAGLVYGQAEENYVKTILGVMQHGAVLARERVKDTGVVSPGEAYRLGSGMVLRQETIDRIRALNNGFMNAFSETGAQLPRAQRMFRYIKYVAKYPERPSHVLLKDSVASDVPAAEVAYGNQAMQRYFESFDRSVGINWESGVQPDLAFFMDEAVDEVVLGDLVREAAATQEALEGAL